MHRWLEHGSYQPHIGASLRQAKEEIIAWCGWLAIDAGKRQLSADLFTRVLIQGRISGNAALEVRCLAQLSLASRPNDPSQSLQMALAAQRIGAHWATPRLRGLLHLRAAMAYAAMSDQRSMVNELANAADAVGEGVSPNDPCWIWFVFQSEVDGIAGLAWSRLGAHEQATESLRRVTARTESERPRNVAYYASQLASSLCSQHDYRGANEAGMKAIRSLATGIQSARVSGTLTNVQQQILRAGGQNEATEFLESYKELQVQK